MANTTNFAVEKPTPGGYRNTWGGTLNTGFDKLTELLALALPLGTIQMYPLTTAPAATSNGGTWLVCKGQSLVRATYPDLHTLITNKYGTYPDGNTFLLPDLRSRVPVGYNTDSISGRSTRALALGSGTETHTLVDAEIPLHVHPITDDGHIHPVTDASHFHVGDQTGGKTGAKTLVITDPEHSHTFTRRNDWGDGVYDTGFVNGGLEAAGVTTSSSATGISIADHDHSLTTDTKPTGITTTGINPSGRITITNEQTSGDGTHNNMQPYLVVNYIILAKHPSF